MQRLFLAALLAIASVPTPRADAAAVFPDVPSSHPYAEAISSVREEGLMTGHGDGMFRPDQILNRAEFVTVLMRSRSSEAEASFCLRDEGKTGFPDVPLNAWFAGYVCSARSVNIARGYPDGTFRPNAPVNMAEGATLVARAWNLIGKDLSAGNAWHQAAVAALREIGAIPASARSPEHSITRGEFAFILEKVIRSEETKALAAMPHGTSSQIDIAYGSDVRQRLDVFYDPQASGAPVIHLVHGGKWVHGRKENMYELAVYFRSLGYTVVTTDYRLSELTGNAYPIPVQDVACSIAWTKDNARRFGGDPGKVVVFGFSGGAHMGALVSYDPERKWLEGCSLRNKSLAVAGYIGVGGAYDFDSVIEGHGDPMKLFLGTRYGIGKWEEAEPVNYVSVGDPPALIAVGTEEESLTTSKVFAEKLQATGVPVALEIFEGFHHEDFVEKLPADAGLQHVVTSFLDSLGW